MTKSQKLGFEEAVDQLERIIEGIESGDVGLEESIAQYEKGMKLINHCRTILDTAQTKIAELTADGGDAMKVEEGTEQDKGQERTEKDDGD